MKWPADKIKRREVSELLPYAKNSRLHSEEQVDQIAASIKEWGWTTPVLVDEQGEIIAGHGRVMAAKKLGIDKIPTMEAAGWSAEQKKAYVLADNQIAQNASWDDEVLKHELGALEESGFDLTLLGWGEELPEFAELPDYALLEESDLGDQLDDLAAGVKKAIQIEFEAEDYAKAQELVAFWRKKSVYVGSLLIDKLDAEKAKL
jgi:hypothetical protein